MKPNKPKHHPYCEYLYRYGIDWGVCPDDDKCFCRLLEAYDTWRKKQDNKRERRGKR